MHLMLTKNIDKLNECINNLKTNPGFLKGGSEAFQSDEFYLVFNSLLNNILSREPWVFGSL